MICGCGRSCVKKFIAARGSNRKRRTGESGAGAGKSGVGASVSESRRSVEARDTSGDGHGRGRASKAARSDHRVTTAVPETEEEQERLGRVLDIGLRDALAKLDDMRRAEGRHLVDELRDRLARIGGHVEQVRGLLRRCVRRSRGAG